MKTYTFTVTGSGRFPLDMLRYDGCWPCDGDSVTAMSISNRGESRSANMRGMRMPAEGRWESFGWKVTKVKLNKV